MAKVLVLILLASVSLLDLLTTCEALFACPAPSLCVPRPNCPLQNITFDSADDNYKGKFVCGILEESAGFVCCSNPTGVPDNFHPNQNIWYFSTNQPQNVSRQTQNIIIPYPGLEPVQQKETPPQRQSCPITSLCVTPTLCPQYGVSHASEFSTEYTCGTTQETIGQVCCLIQTIADGFSLKNDDTFRIYSDFAASSSYSSSSSRGNAPPQTYSLEQLTVFTNTGPEKVKEIQVYSSPPAQKYDTEWECGVTLGKTAQLLRIYSPSSGDRTEDEGSFPWHVGILTNSYKYLCSGVVVKDRVVVTVAHCVDKYRSSDLLVRVGDTNLGIETESYPAYDLKVSLIVVHPNFDKVRLESDIAVVELEVSMRSIPNVRPACLPGGKLFPAINKCRVPGWGQFSRSPQELPEFSYKLKAANFFIIDKGGCQNSFRRSRALGAFFKLQKSVLCAKGYSNADTCKGDGGGGLVCTAGDVYVLRGLVSYGLGCGYGLPGVYTDVELFLEFINYYTRFIGTYKRQDFQTITSQGQFSSQVYGGGYNIIPLSYEDPSPISSGYVDTRPKPGYVERPQAYEDPIASPPDYNYLRPRPPISAGYIDPRPTQPGYIKKDIPSEPSYVKPPPQPAYADTFPKPYINPPPQPGYLNEIPKPSYVIDTPTQPNYVGAPPRSPYTNVPPQPGYDNAPPKPGYGNAPPQPGYGIAPPQPGYGNAPPQPDYGNAPPQPGYGNAPPQPGYGNAPQPDYGNAPPQPGYGNAPPQPGYGNAPPQPGYGKDPPQPGYGKDPPQPGYGNALPQPGYGNAPPQLGYGNAPPQPGYGKDPPQPDYGNAPPQPGYGNAPPQPGYGNAPPQPGYGNAPPQPGYGNAPPQPGYGNAPPQPGYGNAPPQPGYGNAPPQPGYGNAPPQPGYVNAPPQPGYVNAPPQPGYGKDPPQPGYGNAPPQPGYGKDPPQPGYGKDPPQPDYGNAPPQPGYGNAPPQPGYGGARPIPPIYGNVPPPSYADPHQVPYQPPVSYGGLPPADPNFPKPAYAPPPPYVLFQANIGGPTPKRPFPGEPYIAGRTTSSEDKTSEDTKDSKPSKGGDSADGPKGPLSDLKKL